MRRNVIQERFQATYGWLAAAPAAKVAGIGSTTLYRWMDGGEVKSMKVGGRRYVCRADLEAKVGPLPIPAGEVPPEDDVAPTSTAPTEPAEPASA